MTEKAFQDQYPDELAHCYGCGRLNPEGLHVQSYWDGEESVARYVPRPYHIALPGFVYGGLLASLLDCHGTGTAAAAASRAEGKAIGQDPTLAGRMHRMTPLQQAAFVGQISAALAARVPQISKAPAPGEPVSGKSTAPVTLENADFDDFVKIRRRQIAQRDRH